jgi:hypothetical protein
VDKLGITYPVVYGMDAEAVSELTGAFYEKERKILQPTGILLRPDRTVVVAVYSSGPIGRFVAQDVLNLRKHWGRVFILDNLVSRPASPP